MKIKGLSRHLVGLCAAAAALFCVSPAGAGAATVSTAASWCSPPPLTQTFLSFGDANWYTAAPGESYDRFPAAGWTLTGGAKIVTTRLADGRVSQVLDLPSGATATSPAMCVTNYYPTARSMVRNLAGSTGVGVYVSYPGLGAYGITQASGTISSAARTGWSLSRNLQIVPGNTPGWQLAQLKLVAMGNQSEYQLYNLYIDPRMT